MSALQYAWRLTRHDYPYVVVRNALGKQASVMYFSDTRKYRTFLCHGVKHSKSFLRPPAQPHVDSSTIEEAFAVARGALNGPPLLGRG